MGEKITMKCIRITEENMQQYVNEIDPEMLENIGRKYYRARALHEDVDHAPQAIVVWKLLHIPNEKKTAAEIRWFYAKSEAAAGSILEECEQEFVQEGVTKVFFEWEAEDEELKAALKDHGFSLQMKESRELVLTVEELSPLLGNGNNPSLTCVKSIDRLTFRQFRTEIKNCMKHGRMGALEDLDELPFDWFEPEVSCFVQIDGNICGFLMVHRTVSKRLAVKLFTAWRPAANQDLIHMIRFAIQKAQAKYDPKTQVVIRTYDATGEALTGKLFAKAVRQKLQEAQKTYHVS